MTTQSVTAVAWRNFAGAFLGGALGIIACAKLAWYMLPVGCIAGVFSGFYAREIREWLVAHRRELARGLLMILVIVNILGMVGTLFWYLTPVPTALAGKALQYGGAAITLVVVAIVLWRGSIAGRKFRAWLREDRQHVLQTVYAIGHVSAFVAIWPLIILANGVLYMVLQVAWVVWGVVLGDEIFTLGKDLRRYRAGDDPTNYQLRLGNLFAAYRDRSIWLFGARSFFTGWWRYAVVTVVTVLSVLGVATGCVVGFFACVGWACLQVTEFLFSHAPWLCLANTITVTVIMAWLWRTHLAGPNLWLIALATGTLAGVFTECLRRTWAWVLTRFPVLERWRAKSVKDIDVVPESVTEWFFDLGRRLPRPAV